MNELSTLQFKRDFKSLKKILAYKDSIQSELIQLAKSRESLNEVCLRAIEKGVKLPTWAQTLTPTIGDTFSISSIFYSFMTFQVHPLSLFFLIGGTWRELVSDESIISRTFRKLNISKIKPSDKILPFVLAYGRDSVTYKEAKQLHQEILKITSTNV
ncbi:MAG: hypothetical protein IPG21_05240 [Saprospiraceae bacterium]|nr:hypothetical protein [Candidatus Vicinibacter affinis]